MAMSPDTFKSSMSRAVQLAIRLDTFIADVQECAEFNDYLEIEIHEIANDDAHYRVSQDVMLELEKERHAIRQLYLDAGWKRVELKFGTWRGFKTCTLVLDAVVNRQKDSVVPLEYIRDGDLQTIAIIEGLDRDRAVRMERKALCLWLRDNVSKYRAEETIPVAKIRDYIEGMSVSVDTGKPGYPNLRYFGTVSEAMDDTSSKNGAILLVQNAEANEPAPVFEMQPIYSDVDGVLRFKPNAIVSYLRDSYPGGLNKLLVDTNGKVEDSDWEQFYQLIGYSVDGYVGLDFISEPVHDAALAAADYYDLLHRSKRSV